jgi:hypothetical protein
MSNIEKCPTCGGNCKTTTDRETGAVTYKAVQDEDAFKKIEQLKQQLMKKTPPKPE